MPRRLLALVAAVTVSLLAALPAHARTSIVAERSTRAGRAVYLSHSLKPGHRYRLTVTTHGRRSVDGLGIENYVFIRAGNIGTGIKPLHIRGTTPFSFTFGQPIRHLGEWSISINVQLKAGNGLTLRLLDLG